MATELHIENTKNGYKEVVDQKTYDALKKAGASYRIVKTVETAKAKAPQEVTEAKK